MVKINYYIIIYLLLIKSLANCLQDLTCNEYCSSNNSTASAYSFKSCFCTECSIHNDCCVDAQLSIDESSKKHVCNVKLEDRFIYSVSKCSNHFESTKPLINKCESFDGSENSKLIDFIPVYSYQTNETYRNFYCAKCNIENMNLKMIQFYQLNIDRMFPTLDFEVENILNLTSVITLNKIIENRNEFTFHNISNKNMMSINQRSCFNYIDSCLNGTGAELRELCSNYTSIRYQMFHNSLYKVFKNKHCALCNGIQIESLTCVLKMRSHSGVRPFSLQMLFDISELYDDDSVKTKIIFKSKNSTKLISINNCTNETNNLACDNKLNLNLNLNENLKCFKRQSNDDLTQDDLFKRYVSFVGQIISIISLILLLIMYISNKLLRNLPGKILISLSLSLLLSQFVFVLTPYVSKPTILDDLIDQENGTTNCILNYFNDTQLIFHYFKNKCFIFGVLNHYLYLSFFFWTNVMAYDLYKMLSILASSSKKSKLSSSNDSKTNDSRLFIKYSLFAWISPLIIVSVLIALQFYFNYVSYGFSQCYISNQKDSLIFFILPTSLILTANTFFTISSFKAVLSIDKTSHNLFKDSVDSSSSSKKLLSNTGSSSSSTTTKSDFTKRSIFKMKNKSKETLRMESLTKKDNVKSTTGYKNINNCMNNSTKKRLILFSKIFFITGITWTLGLINLTDKNSLIWILYVFFNSLQGFFIFLSYAFHSKTNSVIRNSFLFQYIRSLFNRLKCCQTRNLDESNNNINNTKSTEC